MLDVKEMCLWATIVPLLYKILSFKNRHDLMEFEMWHLMKDATHDMRGAVCMRLMLEFFFPGEHNKHGLFLGNQNRP